MNKNIEALKTMRSQFLNAMFEGRHIVIEFLTDGFGFVIRLFPRFLRSILIFTVETVMLLASYTVMKAEYGSAEAYDEHVKETCPEAHKEFEKELDRVETEIISGDKEFHEVVDRFRL